MQRCPSARLLLPLLLLCLVIAPAAAAATLPAPKLTGAMPEATLDTQLDAAWEAARRGDSVGVQALLQRVLHDPRLARSSNALQGQAAGLAAWLAIEEGRTEDALRLLQRAQDFSPDLTFPLDIRVLAFARADRPVESARAVREALAMTADEAGTRFSPALVRYLTQALRDNDAALQPLLLALFEARWTENQQDPQQLWVWLAELQVESGHADALQRTVARIDQPEPLLYLDIDRRFDAAMAARTDPLSVEAALARHVDRLRDAAQAHPADLPHVQPLVSALLLAGDHPGVLEASAAWATATPEDYLYDPEATDLVAWMLNTRAEAQRRLGQTEAALATLRRAMSFGVGGQPAVSQQLNLALWLADAQQPAQALALLADLKGASPYGESVADLVRVIAYQQLHDAQGVARATAAIAGRTGNDRQQYLHAMLAQGRLEEAANDLIARLRDPQTRQACLREVQQYGQIPLWPLAAERHARLLQVLQRDDVQAAIEDVGVRRRYALFPFE